MGKLQINLLGTSFTIQANEDEEYLKQKFNRNEEDIKKNENEIKENSKSFIIGIKEISSTPCRRSTPT